MVKIALFAALTAVLSQIALPIGPIPINLALISVFMAGRLLGWKYGAMSQIVFVLLGLIGLPVFAGFGGGIGTLAGPTGGFIISYIPCAALAGKNRMVAGLAIVYTLGISQYMYITDAHILDAIAVCILPFLIGDFIKIILSNILVKRIRRSLHGNQ